MTTRHFRILAVDDDRPILDLYQKILCPPRQGPESFHSTTSLDLTLCEQADEAVELVRVAVAENRPFALAFIDVHLPPGKDGVWAAEEIRKLDPNIGIALVTGHLDTDLGEVGRRVPPPDKLLYLQKPFNPKEIWQFAASMCTKWETEGELRQIQVDLEEMVEQRTSAVIEANRQLEAEIKNRLEVEKALRASIENFRNMITSNADGIIIFDKNQIVRFVNSATESLLEKKTDQLVGKPLGYPAMVGKTTELDIVRRTKTSAVAEMRVVETRWEGETAYLASLRDITERVRAKEQLQRSLNALREIIRGTIRAMAATVEKRDPYTAGHQQRVADLSRAIATQMGLSSETIEAVYLAAMIHDIGKVGTPTEILVKPGELTETEFNMIQPHPQVGHDILKTIKFPWPIAHIVLQHHERMNGSGYPEGLSCEKILLEARILGVADVVEAMASHRPYRPAVGIKKALEEISKNRGVLYDPKVVDICLRLFTEKGFEFS